MARKTRAAAFAPNESETSVASTLESKDGPAASSSANGVPPCGSVDVPMSNPYLEAISKRVKQLQKKRARVEGYEEQQRNPDLAKTLNADQLALIRGKEAQILGPLRELEDLAKTQAVISLEQAKHQQLESARQETEWAEKTATAKEEGRQEARQTTNALVKFLRQAGINRQTPSGVAHEDAALESMLVILFEGDTQAVEAAEKMAVKSEEIVPNTESVTFARIRQLAFEAPRLDASSEATAPDPIAIDPSSEEPEEQRVPRQRPTSINFLNASELDEQQATTPQPAPPQTYDQSYVQAQEAQTATEGSSEALPVFAQADVAGGANAAATKWDQTEQVVKANGTNGANETEQNETPSYARGPRQDFREVEKRGRGRGGYRGRGERGFRRGDRGGRGYGERRGQAAQQQNPQVSAQS